MIYYQPHISQYVFYLFTRIEAEPAVYPVRYIVVTQGIFQGTALCIGTVQDGNVGVVRITVGSGTLYLVGDDFRLIAVCKTTENLYLVPLRQIGVDSLGYLKSIFGYQRIGSIYDILCRTIVFFEFEDTTALEIFLERENIIYICSAERVDTLRIVSHNRYSPMFLSQKVDNTVLGYVGILIFVYEDKCKTIAVFGKDIGIIFKQKVGMQQYVVEVHSVGLAATCTVRGKDFGEVLPPPMVVVAVHIAVGSVVVGGNESVFHS